MANGTLVKAKSTDAAEKAWGRNGNMVAEAAPESRDRGRDATTVAHVYLNQVSSTWVINLLVFPSSALPVKRATGQIRGGRQPSDS